MSDLTLIATDTNPSVSGALTESGGGVLVLTGCDVRFQMRPVGDGRYSVDAEATILDEDAGTVRYDFVPGDLVIPGEYVARWQITFSDDAVQHTEPENTITVEQA